MLQLSTLTLTLTTRKRGEEENKSLYLLLSLPEVIFSHLSLLQLTNSPDKPVHHNNLGDRREMPTYFPAIQVESAYHAERCMPEPVPVQKHWKNTAGGSTSSFSRA